MLTMLPLVYETSHNTFKEYESSPIDEIRSKFTFHLINLFQATNHLPFLADDLSEKGMCLPSYRLRLAESERR